MEYEADMLGLHILTSACYNPVAAPIAMKKITQVLSSYVAQLNAFELTEEVLYSTILLIR